MFKHSRLYVIMMALILGCTLLLPSPSNATFPGSKGLIAFTSDMSGTLQIHVMRRDGTGLRQVTNDPSLASNARWSPNGRWLLYTSTQHGSYDIYKIRPDGTGNSRLTWSPYDDQFPAWSASGKRIFFASNRTGDQEIYRMNIDGGGRTRLTRNEGTDTEPIAAADGTSVVFVSYRGSTRGIWKMRPDGSRQRFLANAVGNNDLGGGTPDWSPDSRKIAFAKWSTIEDNPVARIWIMNRDGSNAHEVTHGDVYDGYASWSPTGERILFASCPERLSFDCDIYTAKASNGSARTRLTFTNVFTVAPDWQTRPASY